MTGEWWPVTGEWWPVTGEWWPGRVWRRWPEVARRRFLQALYIYILRVSLETGLQSTVVDAQIRQIPQMKKTNKQK